MGPYKTKKTYHIAENRLVFTFEPDGWPAGVITGHGFNSPFAKPHWRKKRTFFVEHVIVLPGSPANTLLGTLSTGLQAARDLGYDDLVLFLHDQHPLADGLKSLVHRYKFKYDGPHEDGEYWRKGVS